MTNREAIEILGQYDVSDLHFYTTDGEETPFTEWSDAIEMAISALQTRDSKTRSCDTCKHNPPSKKWPCVDCDMREPADRWEPQELSKNLTELDKENGELHPTCTGSEELKSAHPELCEDAVSREAVRFILPRMRFKGFDEYRVSLDLLDKLPSVTPKRKTGQWIPSFNGRFTGGAYWFHCSKCERIVPDVRNGGWNFCPNCGERMEV